MNTPVPEPGKPLCSSDVGAIDDTVRLDGGAVEYSWFWKNKLQVEKLQTLKVAEGRRRCSE